MQSLENAIDTLSAILERILAVALVLGIFLNFINVVGRYLSGFTLHGVDEVEIYILIWISFLGAAIVTWRRENLRMDVLLNACPAIVQTVVTVIEMLVMFAVAAFVAYQSFRYVERVHALGATSDIAGIPTWIPHSAIPISFGAIALIVVVRGVQRVLGFDPDAAHPVKDQFKP